MAAAPDAGAAPTAAPAGAKGARISALSASAIKPFLPAKDYLLSIEFYRVAFKAKIVWKHETVCELELPGGVSILVQNFYVKPWAENTMLQLRVDNLSSWWEHFQAVKLEKTFAGVVVRPPQVFDYGLREIHLIDPAGCLWHIAEPAATSQQQQ